MDEAERERLMEQLRSAEAQVQHLAASLPAMGRALRDIRTAIEGTDGHGVDASTEAAGDGPG
jgi:prefoldin subunit 5